MSVYEMASHYYPKLWDKTRLQKLVEAGKLTEAQFREIVGESEV